MGRHYAEIAFTPAVQAEQAGLGSRAHFARVAAEGREDGALGPEEAGFIEARDGFFLATVSSTGWPYLQHRGGPVGFVQVLDAETLGFADLRGNRQHVSLGNLATDDRVSLFFLDHARRRRLKLFGHARVVRDDPALLARLTPPGREALAESAMLIRVAGFEWNCPQHITPRFTAEEWAAIAATG
ncbi:pyridoxamine 5'-phosphate oxidase family protein [Siccirubricoccus sp. KC 17139]|uniref:Pyridoxamine 5'-phosphate oxidase family protein n=1 Tax=Siccirubricoccus soli TaxID=2899147 RepID=A0ABT1DA15_9PROT|nr:pyridoxamine 5'-phosphate oxidase family protein [Siccirubricoccus soli]MCO6418758.1 pyridoxamine 5'-phosphate oxidase family protein [Siccirubricoccus soli]MCP2684893.1 pyridoxamine 5'-phosphate oxidase family protein [Siccirubricoccus soli]